MEKAVISGTTKTFGKDVLQNKPKKVFALDRARTHLTGSTLSILKRYIAVFVGDDTSFADDASVEIACQVFERGFAGADGCAVDNPLVRHFFGKRQRIIFHSSEETCPKDFG